MADGEPGERSERSEWSERSERKQRSGSGSSGVGAEQKGWERERSTGGESPTSTTCTDSSQLDDALTRALAHQGPALVEVVADPELV